MDLNISLSTGNQGPLIYNLWKEKNKLKEKKRGKFVPDYNNKELVMLMLQH